MKTIKFLLLATLLAFSFNAYAQFGGGGGFGGGGYGGGRQGAPNNNMGRPVQNQKNPLNDDLEDGAPKIGNVLGTVIGLKDGIAVEYATISIVDTKTKKTVTGGITNVKGLFNIKQIPAGEYTAEISFMGFNKYTSAPFSISNKAKTVELGKVLLEEKADMLDEVVIQSEVTTMENRIDKKVVNIGKDMITAGGTAKDIFENLPMVDVDFDGEVQLQGASVTVLLNNRPSGMSIADLIESLPADAIEKVELITNPSAKDDPDGVGGIINIITKRGSIQGISFNARVGIDTKGKWNGGVNFSTLSNKTAFSLNYNFRYSQNESDNETYRANYRTTALQPNPYLNYQFGNSSNTSISHNIRASFDYLPNKKTAFSYSIMVGPRRNENESTSSSYYLPMDTPMSEMTKEIAQQIVEEHREDMENFFNRYRENENITNNTNVSQNLTFRRDYSSYEDLVVDINHSFNVNNSKANILNTAEIDDKRITTYDNTTNDNKSNQLTARVDYEKEVRGVSKFEVGIKGDFIWRDMPYFYYIDEIPDMERSNHFKYEQQLYSIYATYAHYVGNFTFKAGLRGEETVYRTLGLGVERSGSEIIYSPDADVVFNRNYFSLFPSAAVSYRFGSNNEININYSRRVSRPNVNDLNPSYRFSDPMYVNVGNPFLDPSFTNSVSLGYYRSLSNKGSVTLNVSYRNSTDDIQRITTRIDPTDPTKPESDVLYTTSANAGSSQNIGASFSASYKIVKNWNVRLNMNYSYREVNIPDKENYLKNSNRFSLNFNTNYNIIKTNTRFQLGLRYQGPQARLQGTSNGMLMTNAGISQDFFKKKLGFSVRVNDIFDSARSNSNTFGEDFVMFNNNHYSQRTVQFSVSYRFSDIKFKKDKRAKSLQESDSEELTSSAESAD